MSDGPDPDDFAQLGEGQLASRAREAIEDELTRSAAKVDDEVFRLLESGGTLDPQYAVQSWMNRYAIHKLRKQLLRKERRGDAAAKRLAPHLKE